MISLTSMFRRHSCWSLRVLHWREFAMSTFRCGSTVAHQAHQNNANPNNGIHAWERGQSHRHSMDLSIDRPREILSKRSSSSGTKVVLAEVLTYCATKRWSNDSADGPYLGISIDGWDWRYHIRVIGDSSWNLKSIVLYTFKQANAWYLPSIPKCPNSFASVDGSNSSMISVHFSRVILDIYNESIRLDVLEKWETTLFNTPCSASRNKVRSSIDKKSWLREYLNWRNLSVIPKKRFNFRAPDEKMIDFCSCREPLEYLN